MFTSCSCSWCHKMNRLIPGHAVFCSDCGHRADVPMSECDCHKCRRYKSMGDPDAERGFDEKLGDNIAQFYRRLFGID